MSRAWFFRTVGLCLAAAATTAALAQDPEERLYVLMTPLDPAGPSSVTMFDVLSDGALVQGGTYDIGGQGRGYYAPQGIAIDSGARFLFVANNISLDLSVLAIGSGGALAPVATSPVPLSSLAVSLATHPVLPRLYVPLDMGQLQVFGIDGAGGLDLLQAIDAGFMLRGVVVSRSGAFLYVISGFFGESSVRAYHVAADGTLAEIAGSPFPVADSRLWLLAISPDGRRLYAQDLDRGIFAFDIDPAGGLTPVVGSPFAVGPFSENLALTPDGRFLYVNAPFNRPEIFGFAVASDGSLPPVPGSPFGGDYTAAALLPSVVSPRLYLVSNYTRRITTFGIDLDGSLTQLGPRTDVVDDAGRAPSSAVALGLSFPVAVDIRPGSVPNPVNPRSFGVIPVAILGASGFDVTTVLVSSVRFGPSGAPPVQGGEIEDVDGDGELDLVLHFRTAATGIACGDTSAGMTGTTTDGRRFQGQDSIVTRGCHSESLELQVPEGRPRRVQVAR
jgi:6-phosphogluconolactonase (cycloisomerase 2 family)